MAHFLLVYDRRRGELLRKQRFPTDSDALRARFAAEHEFAGRDGIEVVVLSAESEHDLSITHGRYFVGLDELASRIT